MVFLHGLFGSKSNWNRIGILIKRASSSSCLAKTISSTFPVSSIVPDARSHGESFQDPDMSIETQADDLRKLLDQLNIKKTILLGHSMVFIESLPVFWEG